MDEKVFKTLQDHIDYGLEQENFVGHAGTKWTSYELAKEVQRLSERNKVLEELLTILKYDPKLCNRRFKMKTNILSALKHFPVNLVGGFLFGFYAFDVHCSMYIRIIMVVIGLSLVFVHFKLNFSDKYRDI